MKTKSQINDEIRRLQEELRKNWDFSLGQPLTPFQQHGRDVSIANLKWVLSEEE